MKILAKGTAILIPIKVAWVFETQFWVATKKVTKTTREAHWLRLALWRLVWKFTVLRERSCPVEFFCVDANYQQSYGGIFLPYLHNSPTVCQYHSCTWWHTRAWMHREWCRLGVLYLYTRKGNDSSYHLNYLHEKGSMPHRIPTACLCRSQLWMSTSGNLSQPSCSGVAGCLDRWMEICNRLPLRSLHESAYILCFPKTTQWDEISGGSEGYEFWQWFLFCFSYFLRRQ